MPKKKESGSIEKKCFVVLGVGNGEGLWGWGRILLSFKFEIHFKCKYKFFLPSNCNLCLTAIN